MKDIDELVARLDALTRRTDKLKECL